MALIYIYGYRAYMKMARCRMAVGPIVATGRLIGVLCANLCSYMPILIIHIESVRLIRVI